MNLATFERMVRRLRGSYEKKTPDITISGFWYEEAGAKIPDEAADWIGEWVKGQYSDRWPNHFQDVLKRAHQAWFEAHPEKRAYEAIIKCTQPNCEDGLFYVQRRDEQLGYWADYALPCICGKRRMGSVPRWTWDQIIKAGYRIKPEPVLVRRYNPREHGTIDDAMKRTADGMGWW